MWRCSPERESHRSVRIYYSERNRVNKISLKTRKHLYIMDKCATGVCLSVGSWMENKPLVIGIAVAIFALIVGGYFWFRSRSSAPAAEEQQVEEFVGRQGATREEFEAAAAAAAAQQGGEPPQQEEEEQHQHQE